MRTVPALVLLFSWFILRRLRRESGRASFTVLGIALGVAVVLAVRLANQSAIEGFRSALDTIAGRTSLEISSAGGGVAEERLADLGWLQQWGDVSPVIEGDAAAIFDGREEALHVLGVDILQDQPFRQYTLQTEDGPQPSADAFLRLLADSSSVIVTEPFAARHRLHVGSTLPVVFGDSIRNLSIRGVLANAGAARVLDGNLALMDIAAAQWAFGRLGTIDRLDVRLHDASRLDQAEGQIAARLPRGLTVQRPARRGAQVERMLASFQFNLGALSMVALLVGVFLLYNTVAAGVVARRAEIGMLRAVGAGRRALLGLFLGEALTLAVIGCALGVVLGWGMAWAAVSLTSSTISTLYVNAPVRMMGVTAADVAAAFGLGVPLALAAALAPALEAWRISPLEAIAASSRDMVWTRPRWRSAAAAAVLLALAGVAARQPPVADRPVFGFLSAILLILGASFLAPTLLFMLGRLTPRRWPLFAVEGRLATAQIAASIPRVSVPVAALATSIAMLVAIAVMVGSFRQTVIYWVGQTLQADLFVATGRRSNLDIQPTISAYLLAAVRRDPDVSAVDSASSLNVSFRERLVVVGGTDWHVMLAKRTLVFKSPGGAADAVRQALGQDAVVISESFSLRFDVHAGDTLTLPVARGTRQFRVLAVYYDYSTDRGVVLMDRQAFARAYGATAPTSLAVYLKPDVDPDAARRRLLAELGPSHRVFIHTNASLRREVLRIFDRTFAITYGLEAIAILVALLGVAGTMITLVLDRRMELTLLRLVGADSSQVRRAVMIESGLLGVASQTLGLPVGFLLSVLLIDVINVQSFGWTIQWHIPVLFLVQAVIVLLAASIMAGLYPARVAGRAMASVEREAE